MAVLKVRGLRHDGKGKIIPVAAFVVSLEGVLTNNQGRAIWQIGESAVDSRGCGVVDDGENGAGREQGAAVIGNRDRTAGHRDAVGYHLIRGGSVTVDFTVVNAIGIEAQFTLDTQDANAVSVLGGKKRAAARSSAEADRPGDNAVTSQRAGSDLNRARASGGAARVFNQECSTLDGCAGGIGARARESQCARADLCE